MKPKDIRELVKGCVTAGYIEGKRDGRKEAKAEMIEKENKMECLLCGKSLQEQIMGKKIHLHFCEGCRDDMLCEMVNHLKKEVK